LLFIFLGLRKGAVNEEVSELGNINNFFGAVEASVSGRPYRDDTQHEHVTASLILFHHHRSNGKGRVRNMFNQLTCSCSTVSVQV
jgi:hypothetical protein